MFCLFFKLRKNAKIAPPKRNKTTPQQYGASLCREKREGQTQGEGDAFTSAASRKSACGAVMLY